MEDGDEQGINVASDVSRSAATLVTSDGMTWLGRNWDKILTAVICTIISGVVGFFAALKGVDADISSIRQEIASLKERENHYARKEDEISIKSTIDDSIKPSMNKLQQYDQRISSVELKLVQVETTSNIVKENSTLILNNQLLIMQYSSIRPVNSRSPQGK